MADLGTLSFFSYNEADQNVTVQFGGSTVAVSSAATGKLDGNIEIGQSVDSTGVTPTFSVDQSSNAIGTFTLSKLVQLSTANTNVSIYDTTNGTYQLWAILTVEGGSTTGTSQLTNLTGTPSITNTSGAWSTLIGTNESLPEKFAVVYNNGGTVADNNDYILLSVSNNCLAEDSLVEKMVEQ